LGCGRYGARFASPAIGQFYLGNMLANVDGSRVRYRDPNVRGVNVCSPSKTML
jgi:hypothetical protein